MTAEIAILNKSAVALAADSKVTITSGAQSKGYDTANKIFTLSKIHPVGIMIFGNAEFMQFPWETIIKAYRGKKGADSEAHISIWAEDFIKFLGEFGTIGEDHKLYNIKSTLQSWFYAIEKYCLQKAQDANIAAPSIEYVNLLRNELRERSRYLQQRDVLITQDEFQSVINNYHSAIIDSVETIFGSHADQGLIEAALSFGVAALCSDAFSPQSSGFVVAGFGEAELFPTLVQYNTDGYIGDKIKMKQAVESDLSRSMPSAIHAFAQREMVQRFMMGIDPSLYDTMKSSFAAAVHDSCLSVLDEYGKDESKTQEVKDNIAAAIDKRVTQISLEAEKYFWEKFTQPVIDMVAVFPKDELAHLAESLVALTSLQRRVSNDAETVGGPIDVALISKGDGFVWIKRKHYFKPELNHHFTRNYMRSVE